MIGRILYMPGQEVQPPYSAVETQAARVKAHMRQTSWTHEDGDRLAEHGHQGSHEHEGAHLNDKLTDHGHSGTNPDSRYFV